MSLRLASMVLSLSAGPIAAAQVCDLTFTACPDQLSGGSINVPLDVISLDPRIPVCAAEGRIKTDTPPSIMFVIDHSGSMDGTDPTHARYSVVTDLLDDIHAAVPNALVGVAVFGGKLAFDARDKHHFQPLYPGTTDHDAFVPLTPLDTVIGGRTGLDTIKALLAFTPSGRRAYLDYETKHADAWKGVSNLRETATDITLGFEAALEAMKSSPSPKNAQFIIFLSDGAAGIDGGHYWYSTRAPKLLDFIEGVNTPTTFTVFFTKDGIAPPDLVTMTANIQANGYSASNPNSALYTIALPASQLQTLLQDNVLNQILTVPATGTDVAVSIVGGGNQKTSHRADSTHFLLPSRMPLNPGTTELQFTYSHFFEDPTVTPPRRVDTSVVHDISVTRSATGTVGGIVSKTCREQSDLALFHEGSALAAVTAGQINLEARLTPPAGGALCTGCTVQIAPSQTPDRESLPLAAAGAYDVAPFTRRETVTPVPGDSVLQHMAADSLVLVWINPENPLDMVRRAYPYLPVPSTLELYAGGQPVDIITADHSQLEVRLTRAPGAPCANCTVEISTTVGADRQTVPLAPGGASFNGSFIRIESVTPVPEDGLLQHLHADSIVVTWINPDVPLDIARRSYPYRPILPTLAVFSGGNKALDTINTLHKNLEIRLTLPSGEPCAGCVVQVFPSRSADREGVVMGGAGPPYRGTIARDVDSTAEADNGMLEHLPGDSLIFFYQNPLNPSQQVRRAYPYFQFANIVQIAFTNDIAKPPADLPAVLAAAEGRQWVISDAPGVVVVPFGNTAAAAGACCRVLTTPANFLSPDSMATVGVIVEASRHFTLELLVYSNLGEVVNEIRFNVPQSEFLKLTPVPGKDARYLRLLWNGLAENGNRAGTGAYIFKTTVTLHPMPGIMDQIVQTTAIRRVGLLRGAGN